MRRLLVVLTVLLIASCTTTRSNTQVGGVSPPPAGAKILIVQPDVELSLLTAAGLREPKADWSQLGQQNVKLQLQAFVAGKGHVTRDVEKANAMEGRVGQLVRLHDAVGTSILMYNYGYVALPTKKDNFDWTLGEGTRELATTYDADYALFTTARGSYASGGRVATSLVFAALGVSVPLGGQQIFASLVDLRTGKVVWFNVATASPSADMREAAGSATLVSALMKDAPL